MHAGGARRPQPCVQQTHLPRSSAAASLDSASRCSVSAGIDDGAPSAQLAIGAEDDPGYMKEFEALKQKISNRTRTVGSIVATYLLVTVDGEAALCALYGMAFSYIYLQWLFWDIDRVKGTDVVWSVEARKIELPMLRSLAQLAAALRQSLQPRLAVVVAMAASVAWYNQAFPETPLPTFYEGCVLLGFLSYKVSLLLLLRDDLSAKGPERTYRPKIDNSMEDELDRWGRPKKVSTPEPTAALPADVDIEKLQKSPWVRIAKLFEDPQGPRS